MRLRATVLGLALGAAPLAGQVRTELFLGATAAHGRTETGATASRTGGLVVGGGGELTVGRLHLGIEYAQGTMDPRGDGALARSLVDGRVALGVRVTDWLTAQVGAHARGRASTSGAAGGVERWLWGEARARVSTPLVGQAVLAEVSLWRAVALVMNVPQGGGSGRGGEAGLRLQLPGHRFWARITYAVDQIRVSGVGRRDTLDGVTIVTGVSLP